MKKLFSFMVLIAALGLFACNNEKKADKTETKTEKVDDATKSPESKTASMVTAHSCGPDCKDGNHLYAHNEVGHTCTEVCGVAHVCGTECKGGSHTYAHGDVGHTCTDACMN